MAKRRLVKHRTAHATQNYNSKYLISTKKNKPVQSSTLLVNPTAQNIRQLAHVGEAQAVANLGSVQNSMYYAGPRMSVVQPLQNNSYPQRYNDGWAGSVGQTFDSLTRLLNSGVIEKVHTVIDPYSSLAHRAFEGLAGSGVLGRAADLVFRYAEDTSKRNRMLRARQEDSPDSGTLTSNQHQPTQNGVQTVTTIDARTSLGVSPIVSTITRVPANTADQTQTTMALVVNNP